MNNFFKNTVATVVLVAISWVCVAIVVSTPLCYTDRNTGKFIACVGSQDEVFEFGHFERYQEMWAPVGVHTKDQLIAWLQAESREE